MSDVCKKGQWVEVHSVILKSQERSTDIPDDTRKVAFESWVKGWALSSGTIGKQIQIKTPAQRTVEGTLTRINPGYNHSFGPGIPELSHIGQELKAMLKEGN